LLSPTSLITALHREVIEKKPEVFKKSCLEDIKAMFPQNPFFAGFGNKINDVWAYRAVGIPKARIFSINHLGEVTYDFYFGFSSTYFHIASDWLDLMFPPVQRPIELQKTPHSVRFHQPDSYSAFTYWKPAVAAINVIDETLLAAAKTNYSANKKADKKK